MSSKTLLVGIGRQTGKTTKLIGLANAFDATVVTPTNAMAVNVKRMAQQMGAKVSATSLQNNGIKELREAGRPIIVDDADLILEDVLGVSIAAMTFDGRAFDARWTV